MTQDWDGGYIADIGYTHDYLFDMSPAHIGLAMMRWMVALAMM
jgi:hypothetical protein